MTYSLFCTKNVLLDLIAYIFFKFQYWLLFKVFYLFTHFTLPQALCEAFHVHAYPRDVVGSVPHHHTKASLKIK